MYGFWIQRFTLGLALLPLFSALPAAAQSIPAAEVGGGYVLSSDTSTQNGSGPREATGRHGWGIDLAFPARRVALVAALAGSASSVDGARTSDLFALGGVRFHMASRSPRVAPFVQILSGVFRENRASGSSETLGVLQPGVGLYVMISPRAGFRAGADYAFVPVGSEGGGSVWSAARLVVGGVVRFGHL